MRKIYALILFILLFLCFPNSVAAQAMNDLGPIKDCTINKAIIDTSEHAVLKFETKRAVQFLGGVVEVSGPKRVHKSYTFSDTATTRELDLGTFDKLGEYSFRLSATSDTPNEMLECTRLKVFRVVDQQQQGALTIETTPTSVDKPILVMENIRIGGLTPNYTYKLNLYFTQFDGSNRTNYQEIKRHNVANGELWETHNKNYIEIQNMCENGEAERTGSNACNKFFDSGIYHIEILETNPRKNIGVVTFKVDTSQTIKVRMVPNPPITTKIKQIDTLNISGLENGNYKIELSGKNTWDGGHLGRCVDKNSKDCDGDTGTSNIWTVAPKDNGVIEANTICENGNTDRVGHPCDQDFRDGDYTIIIKKEGNSGSVLTYTFNVNASNNTRTERNPPCDANGVCKSAIGDIEASPSAVIQKTLYFGMGIGAVIALLIILYGGFKIVTSNGNAESVATGRGFITSAIVGLLFIAFSVFLLQLVAGNLLGIKYFATRTERANQIYQENKNKIAAKCKNDPNCIFNERYGQAITSCSTGTPSAGEYRQCIQDVCNAINRTNEKDMYNICLKKL